MRAAFRHGRVKRTCHHIKAFHHCHPFVHSSSASYISPATLPFCFVISLRCRDYRSPQSTYDFSIAPTTSRDDLYSLPQQHQHQDLLSEILCIRDASHAIRAFNNACKLTRSKPNPYLYGAIIHVLTRERAFKSCKQLTVELIELMRNTISCNRSDELVCSIFKVLDGVRKTNPGLTTTGVFDVLMMAFSEKGMVNEASSVFHVMCSRRVFPDLHACNVLLNGLLKKGKVSCVKELFGVMQKQGIIPNIYLYNTLINACFHDNDSVSAFRYLNDMQLQGIKPTVVTYTIMICGLCKEGKLSEAMDVLQAMKVSSVLPNVYTFSALIDGHCKMADLDKALELYKKMLLACIRPNVVTCSTLIDGLFKGGKSFGVVRMFLAHMIRYGVVPNVLVFNCVLDVYCKSGKLVKALDLYSKIFKPDNGVTAPDIFTYGILVKGLCSSGRVEECENLFDDMRQAGLCPNIVIYNELIDAHCKQGQMERALEVCLEMRRKGIEPNVITFTSLMDGYCKGGKSSIAAALFLEMLAKGLEPDVVAYTALIDGHAKDGKIKEALRIHKEMTDVGILPNVFTLSSLVDGLCKNGKIGEAMDIFLGKMESSYCSQSSLRRPPETRTYYPNVVTYTSLIFGLCMDGQLPKAMGYYRVMRESRIMPDCITYSVLIAGQCRAGNAGIAMNLYGEMLKLGVVPDALLMAVLDKLYCPCNISFSRYGDPSTDPASVTDKRKAWLLLETDKLKEL